MYDDEENTTDPGRYAYARTECPSPATPNAVEIALRATSGPIPQTALARPPIPHAGTRCAQSCATPPLPPAGPWSVPPWCFPLPTKPVIASGVAAWA